MTVNQKEEIKQEEIQQEEIQQEVVQMTEAERIAHDKKMETIEKYRKTVQIASIIGLLITAGIAYWIATGTYFKPVDQGGLFEVHLKQLGIFGPIIFVIVQIVQVVLPIIPGGLVSVSGNLVFGTFWGFVYNFTGIFIGSIIAFKLARRFGEFFVKCFVSEVAYDKYIGWVNQGNRFAWILAVIFILPAAPDDILCMIAGLTKMSLKQFILIFIPTKAISTYVFTWMMEIGIRFIMQDIWPIILSWFN